MLRPLLWVVVDEIVCRYGVPTVLHSDQGTNLNSEVIQCLCNILRIERTGTSAYHPQGNGQVERFNRTLKMMLSKMVKDNQCDWDIHLPRALLAYRTSLHESTGFSPFYLNFGCSPMLPVDVMLGRLTAGEEEGRSIPRYVQEVRQSLKTAYSTARQRLSAAHQRQKELSDRTVAGSDLKFGDRVWLYVPAVKVG